MIKTALSHPDHPIVGRFWGAHSFKHDKTQVYYCDSYDSEIGYWMTNIHDHSDRVNISERAPMRTWWPAEDKGDHFFIVQWGVRFPKKAPEAKPTAEALNQPVITKDEPNAKEAPPPNLGLRRQDP